MGHRQDVTQDVKLTVQERLRRWFAGLGVSQLRKMAVVAILAVTALFGGLDAVDAGATGFKTGEPFSDGQFTVTVDRARLVTELKNGAKTIAPPAEGRRYLGVVVEIRNDGTVPGSLRNELDLRDQPDKKIVGVFRMTDGSWIGSLGPGLTEQVVFLWSLPEDALQEGDSVTVRVWKKTYNELLVTYGKAWLDSTTNYGQIVIPVKAAA
jgi:hypothetical protein